MASLEYSPSAGDGLCRWDEFRAAAFDIRNAPLDLDGPGLLDLMVLKETGNQPIGKSHPFFGRKLQRLCFDYLELA